ncbi:uncharacterized protein K460DRAFT_98336 [Cucurbitaria berberidis CBS 394.84]|uniref:Uncharacterized protein n=1 Tax=Cucurbitaria berberidis CBS 394.84 TaxID=1168544 RepID=A0A9P4L7Y5_9PLEO|nr:uncharacterized protein K460DRAFT_98336 [Cucurbitaria berberidis CBS 394.84]KAF1844774.1 hypothetical protein K460DRAFT_98336 [Cucurbitaria berberidis CBS 394.84]
MTAHASPTSGSLFRLLPSTLAAPTPASLNDAGTLPIPLFPSAIIALFQPDLLVATRLLAPSVPYAQVASEVMNPRSTTTRSARSSHRTRLPQMCVLQCSTRSIVSCIRKWGFDGISGRVWWWRFGWCFPRCGQRVDVGGRGSCFE